MKRFVNLLIGMLVVLVCFVIQTAVLRGSSILSFRPNLLIIAVVSLSLFLGDSAGIFLGFFAGILCDVCFGPLLGFHALLFAWTGYLCGRFTGILFIEDLKFPLLLIFLPGTVDPVVADPHAKAEMLPAGEFQGGHAAEV